MSVPARIGEGSAWWNSFEQQCSDDDDDEPRLMIDISADEDESSSALSHNSKTSQNHNLVPDVVMIHLPESASGTKEMARRPISGCQKTSSRRGTKSKRSAHSEKMMRNLIQETKPVLNAFIKDLKDKNKEKLPAGNFQKLFTDIEPHILNEMMKGQPPQSFEEIIKDGIPEVNKIMKEVKSSPTFEKAKMQLTSSPEFEKIWKMFSNNSGKSANLLAKYPTGCNDTKSAFIPSSVPLMQLQELVQKPFPIFSVKHGPPDVVISSNAHFGDQDCDRIVNVGTNSKTQIPTVKISQISRKARPNLTKSCSSSKINVQLPQPPHLTSAPSPQKAGSSPMSFIPNSSVIPQPPPLRKRPVVDFVIHRLQKAAHEEQQMQKLLEAAAESSEMQDFNRFRTFMKSQVKRASGDMLPALTMIPKQDCFTLPARKTGGRRSPPPMVPIESLTSLGQPLQDDNVIYRLKKLGTDIELETTTTTAAHQLSLPALQQQQYSGATDEDDDDDCVPSMSVDCILSTEPLVTIDEYPETLSFKQVDEASLPSKSKPNVIFSRFPATTSPPPPPSLIPITCTTANQHCSKFRPLLSNTCASKSLQSSGQKSSNRVISKKSRKKPTTVSFKSDIAKLAHALVMPAGAAKQNDLEILNTLRGSSVIRDESNKIREVEIFKIEGEKTAARTRGVMANSVADGCIVWSSQEQPILNVDTDSTSIAHLVEKNMEEESKSKEILPSRVALPVPVEHLPVQSLAPESVSRLFVFNVDQAVVPTLLPSGRKLFACDICSGVYCKLCSVKKHYFRFHVNPRMASERDAKKYGLGSWSKDPPTLDEGQYRCNVCITIFEDKEELKSHLLEHPPPAYEKRTGGYSCERCSLTFSRKKLYFRHLPTCAGLPPKAPSSDSSPRPVVQSDDNVDVGEGPNGVGEAQLESIDVDDKTDNLGISRMCLFCEHTFTNVTARNKHVLQHHHPKRKQQVCTYCKNKKFNDLKDLLKHICEAHNKRYFGCADCKIRFKTKDDLTAHNAESHPESEASTSAILDEKTDSKLAVATTTAVNNKYSKKQKCTVCRKTFATPKELKRHRKKGHNTSKSKDAARTSTGSSKWTDNPYEHQYRNTVVTSVDHEPEFYRNVGRNIRYNLALCMDGKIDTKKPNDIRSSTRSNTMINLIPFPDEENELNFENMYGSSNMNGYFIRNVSRLHLASQLAILRRANVLNTHASPVVAVSSSFRNSTSIADELALKEKLESQSVAEKSEAHYEAVFSGEWIRSKKYICAACFARFNNFWDVEDHRWMKHPNVYGFYYEFVTEQAPGVNWEMKRVLQCTGALTGSTNTVSYVVTNSSTCTKCQKVVTPVSDFHKHILECGGDTTWTSTMFASSSQKRHRKWRPYGARRRKNTTRVRGLKRNIPTTPVKLLALTKSRQKAGDTDTIQKMIANLPPKRITRKIVQFDELDSKNHPRCNSDTNILTRTRKERMDAKTSAHFAKAFATDMETLEAIQRKKKRKLVTGATESEPASPTDSSSDTNAKGLKSEPLSKDLENQELNTSETSASNSDTEFAIKKEVYDPINTEVSSEVKDPLPNLELILSSVPPVEVPMEDEKPILVEKQRKEEEECDDSFSDRPKVQLVDSNTCFPDSAIIIAAMRETIRLTDPIIESQPFTAKKRKRDDSKVCKDCGAKIDTVDHSSCSGCSETKATRTFTCTDCKSVITDVKEDNDGVCDKCSPKRQCRSRASAAIYKLRDNASGRVSLSKGTCTKCNVMLAPDENSKVCDKCSQLQEVRCSVCRKQFVHSGEGSMCEKCSKSGLLTTSSSIVTSNPPSQTAKEQPFDTHSASPSGPKSQPQSRASNKNKVPEIQLPVIICRACNGEGYDLICRKCTSLAKKNKACAICRRRYERPVKSARPVCPSCTAEKLKKEFPKHPEPILNVITSTKKTEEVTVADCVPPFDVEVSTFRKPLKKDEVAKKSDSVLPSTEVVDTCSSVIQSKKNEAVKETEGTFFLLKDQVAVTCRTCTRETCVCKSLQKSKTCVRCNVTWEGVGKGDVRMCPTCENDGHRLEVALCRACRRPSVTVVCNSCVLMSQKLKICARCSIRWDDKNKTGLAVCTACAMEWYRQPADFTKCADITYLPTTEPVKKLYDKPMMGVDRRNSNDIGRVGDGVVPMVRARNSPVSSQLDVKIEETMEKVNTSPSKNNVILICKGCKGLFYTVSSYKQHCETCQARVSCLDAEKKPLLGFAKRNSKGGVEIAAADANGASFDIIEGVQFKCVDKCDKMELGVNCVADIINDSDSPSTRARHELSKISKVNRTMASDDSMNSTIESVIRSVCYEAPKKKSTSQSLREAKKASVVMTSSSVVENSLGTTMMKGQVENLKLAATKQNTETSNRTGSAKKKKSKRSCNAQRSGRTTRSSRSLPEVDVAAAAHSTNTTPVPGTRTSIINVTKWKKRKAEEDSFSLMDDESFGAGSDDSIASRLRRKSIKSTRRVLRSRVRSEVSDADAIIDEDDFKALGKAKTESNPSARKSREMKKIVDSSEGETRKEESGDLEPLAAPKAKPVMKHAEVAIKRNRSLPAMAETFAELGFAITKTNQTISRCEKSCDSSESHGTATVSLLMQTTASKNELEESDRKQRRCSGESDPNSIQLAPQQCDDVGSTESSASATNMNCVFPAQQEYVATSSRSEDFLESVPTFVSPSYNDHGNLNNGLAYNGNKAAAATNGDGYVPNHPKNFEECGVPIGGAQSTTSWYSDAINFLDQRSLGSILDSVNELLTRPEVVSSCATDSVNTQPMAEMRGEIESLQNYQTSKTNNVTVEQEDDTPTIMDLDQQLTISSKPSEPQPTPELESKTVKLALSVNDTMTTTRTRSIGRNNGPASEQICDVCEQVYPNENALNLHMVAIHQFDMFGNECRLNGKPKAVSKVITNGAKPKHRCSHCQKVLTNKKEYEAHVREHLKAFALSKSNADFLKRCITEKLEDILVNKLLANYLKSPQESSNLRNNVPLKIISQINAAKKIQFDSWKSTIADVLFANETPPSNAESTAATDSTATTPTSSSSSVTPSSLSFAKSNTKSKASRATILAEKATEKLEKLKKIVSAEGVEKGEEYPCPMCPKAFTFTHMRNQHLIMVHAPPRQSNHKHLKNIMTGKKKDNTKNHESDGEDVSGNDVPSYLSKNSCGNPSDVENNVPEPNGVKTIDMLRKQISCPIDVCLYTSDSQSELPPALERAPIGEQLSNNTNRSPPKLEAPAGLTAVPAKRPQPGTSIALPIKRNRKMSKKEINLPPAVVKMKAEQALLELSISKFQKLR